VFQNEISSSQNKFKLDVAIYKKWYLLFRSKQ